MFPYFIGYFLISQVGVCTNTAALEFVGYFAGIVCLSFRDIKHHRLIRRQPQWKSPCIIFNDNADETFQRAKNCAVQHHRHSTDIILSHKFCFQPLWHGKIQLQGATLPHTAYAVLERELDFRAIKSAFAKLQIPTELLIVQRRLQGSFCPVPLFFRTDSLYRAGRKLYQSLVKTEIDINLLQQVNKFYCFILHLRFGAKNMRIILREGPNSHDTMQRTGWLISVTRTKFRQPQRQVTIAFQALLEDLNMTRTVHWFDRELPLF